MTPDQLLVAIRSRLDEWERLARAAESATWHAKEPDAFGCRVVSISFEVGHVTASILSGNAEHIAAHDPASTLRQVEGYRRVLARHTPCDGRHGLVDHPIACHTCSDRGPCPTLRDLAFGLGIDTEETTP